MAGNQRIYGSLFAEDAKIYVTNGGGFQGSLVTGGTEVEISGGTSIVTSLFFAPNASVSVSGSGNVKGPIVANTFCIQSLWCRSWYWHIRHNAHGWSDKRKIAGGH